MDRAELAFFPAPGVGHLAPMVELAKVLTTRDDRLSVTVFIMNHSKINTYTQALLSNQPPPRMRFVHLSLDESTSEHLRSLPRGQWMPELVRIHKSRVNEFLSSASTHRLAAFVVDIFCTAFIDVATAEFGVPSYVFFTSSLDCLSLLFHLQSLHDDEKCDITEFKDSDAELRIPGFLTPVPANVWLYSVFDKDTSGALTFVRIPRRLRKIKGILVNTFAELESHALGSLSDDFSIPPIYAVGPVLNLNPGTSNDGNNDQYKDIMMWLDSQPQTSVVFLCFGSMGTFEAEQVVEIARALERSGHRFLWSLRRPPLEGKMGVPTEYENLNEVLPKGFLDRTQEIGKVIGWAPQVAVLSHPAIGGFVSHCGWNSILESLWCGVPMATWPLFVEQQLNAFELVKELGLAVEIKIEYRKDNPVLLTSEEIEKGIKQLMEGSVSAKIRNGVKAMRQKSRKAIIEDGSSYVAVGQFIDVVLSSSPQDITR